VLEDVMPEKLRRAEDEYGELAGVEAAGSLRFAATVEDAVFDADIVIDFVPDELESKLEIFSLLDRMAPPRTILLTPTQTLSITDLASCTYRAGKCVGLRGELSGSAVVEVIRSRFADDESIVAVTTLLEHISIRSQVTDDTEEPMLVKNIASV
jgi:3-hydroxybutyryl-CoA dehydrogenase